MGCIIQCRKHLPSHRGKALKNYDTLLYNHSYICYNKRNVVVPLSQRGNLRKGLSMLCNYITR